MGFLCNGVLGFFELWYGTHGWATRYKWVLHSSAHAGESHVL